MFAIFCMESYFIHFLRTTYPANNLKKERGERSAQVARKPTNFVLSRQSLDQDVYTLFLVPSQLYCAG